MLKYSLLFVFILPFAQCKIEIPVKTVGIITEEKKSGPHGGASFVYGYLVNGKRYDHDGYNDPRVLKGEQFVVIYDSLHPKRAAIEIKKPVFLADDKTSEASGTIYDFYSRGVYFEYEANGIKYKKYQFTGKDSVCVEKGDKYQILYDVKFPQLSIIQLDKPIK